MLTAFLEVMAGHEEGELATRPQAKRMENGMVASDEREVPEVILNEWAQFERITWESADLSPVEPAYFFRGQSSAWPPFSSLARHAARCRLTAVQALAIETHAIKEFQLQAHLYLPAAMLPQPDDAKATASWWALMQHHGVPTRLLDWTASPYVAAYFAVAEPSSTDGVVWMVHVRTVTKFMEENYPTYTYPSGGDEFATAYCTENADPLLYFVELEVHTERMTAQQTRFSMPCQILSDHGKLIASTLAGELPGRHRKLVIPNRLKPEFLRRLRLMNITARTLFPGFDGFGRSVSELVDMCSYYYAERGE